jgi:hypothetical protein
MRSRKWCAFRVPVSHRYGDRRSSFIRPLALYKLPGEVPQNPQHERECQSYRNQNEIMQKREMHDRSTASVNRKLPET